MPNGGSAAGVLHGHLDDGTPFDVMLGGEDGMFLGMAAAIRPSPVRVQTLGDKVVRVASDGRVLTATDAPDSSRHMRRLGAPRASS